MTCAWTVKFREGPQGVHGKMGEERTLTRDVAVLSAGFKSAAVSRWADVNVVLSNGVYSSHRLVLASARRGFLYQYLLTYLPTNLINFAMLLSKCIQGV